MSKKTWKDPDEDVPLGEDQPYLTSEEKDQNEQLHAPADIYPPPEPQSRGGEVTFADKPYAIHDSGTNKELILFRTAPRPDGKLVAMVPDSNPIEAYLVPGDRLKLTFTESQPVRIDDDVVRVHDWYQVIDELLPSREEIIRNVVISILRSGAATAEDLNDNAVRNRALRTAFPYSLPE
jgi:hypothetical protein